MRQISMLRLLIESDSRTQGRIAEAAGLHGSALSSILAGKRPLTRESAERIAHALGVGLEVIWKDPDVVE